MRQDMWGKAIAALILGLVFGTIGGAVLAAGRPLPAAEAFRMQLLSVDAQGARIGWTIAPGYYLYRDGFSATDDAGAALALRMDPGEVTQDPGFGSVEVYRDRAEVLLPGARGVVQVTAQGCQQDGICYPPVTETVTLPGTAPPEGIGAEGALAGNWLTVLAGYFGLGVLLAFTPCVLPMLPILLALLARQGETLRPARGAVLSGAYVLAMAVAFAAIGAVAGWSGRNLQLVLQSPWAIGAMAGLFAVLALPGLGLFEIALPSGLARVADRVQGPRGSVRGAVALGLGAALVVGPCLTAPLAGALLYIAQGGSVAFGAAALFALGLGQGAPLLLAGVFGAALLPRAGAWMGAVRPLVSFVFLALAVWLLSRVVPGTVTAALWAGLLLWGGGWLIRGTGRVRRGLGVLALLGAGAQVAGAVLPGLGGPLATATPEAAPGFGRVSTVDGLETALTAARGRPTLVYVTADWCESCRQIARTLWPDPAVGAALHGVTRIELDVTRADAGAEAALKRLSAFGPPTLLFFGPDGTERIASRRTGPVPVPDFLSAARALRPAGFAPDPSIQGVSE